MFSGLPKIVICTSTLELQVNDAEWPRNSMVHKHLFVCLFFSKNLDFVQSLVVG